MQPEIDPLDTKARFMKYCVGRGVIGPWAFLDISAHDFERVKKANRDLFVLLGIEQKFEMMIDNYLEYEQSLLSLTLGHMVAHDLSWAPFQDAVFLVNRRLANLLTVSRLYNDQVRNDISTIYGECAKTTAKLREAFSVQYDRLFGYRVMEAIRNSLQHKLLPIKRLEYTAGWEDSGNTQMLHYRTTAKVNMEDLRADKHFKRSVLRQLEDCGKDAPDITPFVRQYVEGLSCVQSEIRAVTNRDVNIWKTAVEEMIRRYSAVCGEDVKIAVMYRLDDEERTDEEITLFLEGIDHLEFWRRKPLPTYLSQAYLSNVGA
ncbi:MAG: hypothetical protein ACR2IV_08055 [Bryobacteraceae bacterium]